MRRTLMFHLKVDPIFGVHFDAPNRRLRILAGLVSTNRRTRVLSNHVPKLYSLTTHMICQDPTVNLHFQRPCERQSC